MQSYNLFNSGALCTAVIGAMTKAMKAQRALSAQAIRSSVVKVGKAASSKGCVYGIEFDCALTGNIRKTLEESGIAISEILR